MTKWIQIEEPKFRTSNPIQISDFQLKCFELTSDLMYFSQIWYSLFQLSNFLEADLLKALEGISNIKKETPVIDSEVQMQVDSVENNEISTEKLKKSIKVLNLWLQNAMSFVDDYNDDEDDPSLDEQSNDSQKVPGSKLCSFSDLANALDRRIYLLAALQKTVDQGQQKYRFPCERVAEIYFNEKFDKTDLPEIEKRLKDIVPDSSHKYYELIQSIQQSIENWHSVFDKLQTLLPKLENILSSTTQLECEYEEIFRWIEEVYKFLNEAIAVGDLDLISEQLVQCERLKDFMKQSVEKNFQNILNVAQEAVGILLGENVLHDVIPLIKYIKQTWHDLGDRTLNKLDRLKLAQDLTSKVLVKIDHYKSVYNQIELETVHREDILEEKFISLASDMKCNGSSDLNWDECNWHKLKIEEINNLLTEYKATVIGSEDSLAAQLQTFIPPTGQSNHAYETIISNVNKFEGRFQNLAAKLKPRSKLIEFFLSNVNELVNLISEETDFYDNLNTDFKQIKPKPTSVVDFEDASKLLNEFEQCLSKCNNDENRKRLDKIKQYLNMGGVDDELKRKYTCVADFFEQKTAQLEDLINIDEIFRSMVTKSSEALKRFISDSKECDSSICSLQKWLNDFDTQLDEHPHKIGDEYRTKLENKRQKLISIQHQYTSKFKSFGSREAIFKLDSKCQFIETIFKELTRKLDKILLKNCHHNSLKSSSMNLDDELTILETNLADLGLMINGMEIVVDSEDHDQTIPGLLEKLNSEVCGEFYAKLNSTKDQLNVLESISKSKVLPAVQLSRLNCLKETHNALSNSLNTRGNLILELIDLCNKINQKLLQLHQECNNLLKEDDSSFVIDEQELTRIKQISREILVDICSVKEQLDLSCIHNSDILIGIEEIGARYDEIITEIAERYLLDDDDDEDDIQMNVQHDNSDKIEQKTETKMDIVEEDKTEPTEKKEITLKETSLDTNTCEDSVSEASKQPAPVSLQDISMEIELPTSNYRVVAFHSFKPYLSSLKSLESTMTKLCHRRIIEFSMNTTQQSLKRKALPISLLEGQLENLSKSLMQVRVSFEQVLCAASISGFLETSHLSVPKKFSLSDEDDCVLSIDSPKCDLIKSFNYLDDAFSSDSLTYNEVDELLAEYWDHSQSLAYKYLNSLSEQFKRSRYTFLALHRHWWLIREDTFQFNSEIRKLADWFENVELQLTNGRLTTVTTEQSAYATFDISDLNLLVVAQTQPLLVTQLKTHVPDYAKLQVLFKRLFTFFTHETEGTNQSANDKAQIDARNRINLEMNNVKFRWNSIVRELAWRRECLLGLANSTVTANIAGYPYKLGNNLEFDKLLESAVAFELECFEDSNDKKLQKIEPNFQWHQFEKWRTDTESELNQIKSELTIRDMESALHLHLKLKDLEHDMFRQYLNWMVLTQEPFVSNQQPNILNDKTFIENEFSKVFFL